MLHRRSWGAWCAAGLAASMPSAVPAQVSGPSSARGAAASQRVRIAVDNKAAFCVLPLTIAERLGYFAEEGLAVTIEEFADAQAATQSVQAGASQVLSSGYVAVLLMQARQIAPMTAFVLQGRTPQLVLGVSSQALASGRPLSSLKGLRVGVTGMQTSSHRVARLVLARAGLARNDVRYVAVREHHQALRAFRSGRVDAICLSDPTITQLERDGGLKVVADTRTVQGNADVFGGPIPAACLAAPQGFLQREPGVVQALTDAMVHALKWLQTAGPSDIIRVVPEAYFLGDRAVYLAAFSRAREAWSPDGVMPNDGPSTLVSTLSRLGELAEVQEVNLDNTYTNRFSLKAKTRFRA